MMKKMATRLLAAVLCLVMCMGAAAAENAAIFPQRTAAGALRSLWEMAVVGEDVYFLVSGSDGMEIWRWREGADAELAAGSLLRANDYNQMDAARYKWGDAAEHAVISIFSDGARLMGFNPLNGLIYSISFDEAGPVYAPVVTVQDTAAFFRGEGQSRWAVTPRSMTASGGYAYWFANRGGGASVGGMTLLRISLTDGAVTEMDVPDAQAICAWKEGQLAILQSVKDETGDRRAFDIVIFDPETGEMTEAGRFETPRAVARLAVCGEKDLFLWQDGTTIMGMTPGGEPQRCAYVPSTLNGRMAVAGNTLVFATTDLTISRDIVPGLTAPESLQVMNVSYDAAAKAFAAEYPDVPIEVISDNGDKDYDEWMNSADGADRLDVVRIYTTTEYAEYLALRDQGMLLDLSGDAEIAAWVADLYPPFRELVTGENGEIWAVPTETVSYTGFFVNRKAMTAMGFTEADMPTNLVDLCAFINMWDAEYADRFPNYCCIEYQENTRRFLLDMAVDMWIGHCQATGQPLHFDDPEFRKVLDAVAAVSTVRTDRGMQVVNPEISDYKSGLFWVDCQLVGNWAAYMEPYSDRIFIPLTLTADTPFHAEVDGVELWVVNGQTESAECSMAFLRARMAQVNDKYAHVLLTSRTEAIESPYYSETRMYAERRLGELYMQLTMVDTPEEEASIRRQIAAQEEHLATELARSQYTVTPSAVENYVNVLAPAMYIRADNLMQNTSAGLNTLERACDRWMQGAITTDQFVQELDARLLMLEMAQ